MWGTLFILVIFQVSEARGALLKNNFCKHFFQSLINFKFQFISLLPLCRSCAALPPFRLLLLWKPGICKSFNGVSLMIVLIFWSVLVILHHSPFLLFICLFDLFSLNSGIIYISWEMYWKNTKTRETIGSKTSCLQR